MSNKAPKVSKADRKTGTRHSPRKKTSIWTVPAILGLAVSAVALVELRPQMSVSADGPLLENSQPFTAPFRITNTGYLSFDLESIRCYINSVEAPGLVIRETLFESEGWNKEIPLDRGESKTVSCEIASVRSWPKAADIAMVVDYKFFAYGSRRYFRFVGSGPTGNWQWLPQPSSEIRKSADAEILKWKGY